MKQRNKTDTNSCIRGSSSVTFSILGLLGLRNLHCMFPMKLVPTDGPPAFRKDYYSMKQQNKTDTNSCIRGSSLVTFSILGPLGLRNLHCMFAMKLVTATLRWSSSSAFFWAFSALIFCLRSLQHREIR